jgi:nuclear pore complex protein Nup188
MSQWRPAARVSSASSLPSKASDAGCSSWKAVYSAITSDIELPNEHRAVIERFLSDPEVVRLLAHPFDAYPPASAPSKAAFETKTSAINVTPSPSAKYDIKEIKEDSMWLSKIAKLDEVSALRLVTQECQFRTSSQLLGQFSEEELASIRDAAGNNQYSSSIPVSLLVQGLDPDAIQQQFTRQDSRRQRVLRTYLSERRYLLKSSERLFDAAFLHQAREQKRSGRGKGKAVESEPSWQARSGMALASLHDMDNAHPTVLRGIQAVSANLNNLAEGSGWSDPDGEGGDIDAEWVRTQFIEATHVMELIWQFIANVMGIPTGRVVLEWFRLQQSYGFFSNFESVCIGLSNTANMLI